MTKGIPSQADQALAAALNDLGDRIRGISVHLAARILGLAEADEVLVSETARAVLGGAGFAFEDRGSHTLKGIPGENRVFAVRQGPD